MSTAATMLAKIRIERVRVQAYSLSLRGSSARVASLSRGAAARTRGRGE